MTGFDDPRARWVAVALALAVVGADFLVATTFTGDDHLFLTFARHAPHPLVAFVSDQHGGEYYRPLPMALWWLLGRAGGYRQAPFALLMLGLHAAAAMSTAALARNRRTGWVAAGLFFLAPAPREAALWFAASTDLLATVATLGAVLAVQRGRVALAVGLAALACFSKESAIVLPLLAAAALWTAEPRPATRVVLVRVAPLAAVALLYLGARTAVLGGLGGAGDVGAPLAGRALQIAVGLLQTITGSALLPGWLALGAGGLVLLWAAWRGSPLALLWVGIALLPLLAAGWVVGARYFYLPAVGLALLVGDRLAGRGALVAAGALAAVAVLGLVQTVNRHEQVALYRTRLAAAAAAVADGQSHGHRVFHVAGAVIKDLDLAIKNQGGPGVASCLVLGDVPASFAVLPPALAGQAAFLLAAPPLPPSGAYRFGDVRVVGLARREEAPDLAEVLARLPELRFVRVKDGGWADVTAATRARVERAQNE